MRNNKNNITLIFKNIILFLDNLTSHLTDNKKIITLCFIILTLSLLNITSTSALDYSNNINLNFTISPSLSLSISSSDLAIDNLTPGTTVDSNDITISVVTNASYGYTLSANAISEDLAHSNKVNIFNSIATDADLASLTTDNTWGYSTSLDNGNSWSNYSGLSSSSSTTLLSLTSNASSSVDFRIAAKAGSTQPSGIYTNTITFAAVTKPTPMTLAEAYASEGKTMINGFYTMQDMTSTICNKTEAIGSQLQVLDIRDNKLYWIAKLADEKCWMTQNLDLDLDSNRAYTHYDTDLGWSTENGNVIDEDATWKPMRSTLNFTIGTAISGWQNSGTEPYSANPGDVYFYTSNSDANDIPYNSLQDCIAARHNDCTHYHAGNYYNWSAAVANNNTSGITSGSVSNSICPNNWRLPNFSDNDFNNLFVSQGIIEKNTDNYLGNGFNQIRIYPFYFSRSGGIQENSTAGLEVEGCYWFNSAAFNSYARNFLFNKSKIYLENWRLKGYGFSVRCLAR